MTKIFRVLCNKAPGKANRLLHKISAGRLGRPDQRAVESRQSHRQTYGDDSPRGEHYPDDRTRLAYVYDGLTLKAVVFDEREVERYREETTFLVKLTPAGEARVGDDR